METYSSLRASVLSLDRLSLHFGQDLFQPGLAFIFTGNLVQDRVCLKKRVDLFRVELLEIIHHLRRRQIEPRHNLISFNFLFVELNQLAFYQAVQSRLHDICRNLLGSLRGRLRGRLLRSPG